MNPYLLLLLIITPWSPQTHTINKRTLVWSHECHRPLLSWPKLYKFLWLPSIFIAACFKQLHIHLFFFPVIALTSFYTWPTVLVSLNTRPSFLLCRTGTRFLSMRTNHLIKFPEHSGMHPWWASTLLVAVTLFLQSASSYYKAWATLKVAVSWRATVSQNDAVFFPLTHWNSCKEHCQLPWHSNFLHLCLSFSTQTGAYDIKMSEQEQFDISEDILWKDTNN